MSAVAGIKSELKLERVQRTKAANELDTSRAEYVKAQERFRRDQRRVERLNDRIEALAKALRDLGGTDD